MLKTAIKFGSMIIVATTCIGLALAASGNWSAARSKVDELKTRQGELRRVTPEETRKIVTAICEADEDERKRAGDDAAERVARTVNSQLGDLRTVRDQAYRLLDDVRPSGHAGGQTDRVSRRGGCPPVRAGSQSGVAC